MQELIERLSQSTGLPAADVERLLLKFLKHEIGLWRTGEIIAEEHAEEVAEAEYHEYCKQFSAEGGPVNDHGAYLAWRRTAAARYGINSGDVQLGDDDDGIPF